ncbi:MAG: hypothetical protein J6L98_06935 [Bacteroidales bacterium]|nr:hypothetical protein [Bacteroidales bacterium]
MKNSTKLLSIAAILFSMVSCMEKERATATFTQGSSFEVNDVNFQNYIIDSLMFTPTISFDDLIFFNSSCDETNKGYKGGFKLSTLKGGVNTSDEMAIYASADRVAGVGGSLNYMAFNQTSSMPDYDVTFYLDNFYRADVSMYGCAICNTLYNKRLAEQDKIAPGDYLKVVFEFYYNDALAGKVDKYLIDYRSSPLVMLNEWTEWDIAKQIADDNIIIGSFTDVKIRFEKSGQYIMPNVCVDNFIAQFSVTY